MNNKSAFPKVLFVIYLVFCSLLAINPLDRGVWFVENATVWVVVLALLVLYIRGFRFSNVSYLFMSVFIFMHTIGGHYTFEKVPFDFISDFFGMARNNYDRIAHFSVGFYAFPIVEWVRAKKAISQKWLATIFALAIIVTIAALYEIFEWWYAVHSDPKAGIAVLGSQGDIWDAQKDMLADTLGGVFAVIVAWFRK